MSTDSRSDDIDETAATWVMRLDGAGLDEAGQRELDAWLAEDSRHLGAFVRAQAMWVDLDRVAALAAGRAPQAPRADRVPVMRAAAVAALVVGLALGALGVSERFLEGRESTQIGEVRRLALDDGSMLALNTSSVVQVKFDEDERRIVLRRGEASFQVAHDRERPFIVQAGDVLVRAVGTAFTVRMHQDDEVEVVVTEGVVEVVRNAGSARPAAKRVTRNHEVVVAEDEAPLEVAPLSESELTRRLAWQEGRLIFEGEELGRAIAEVNRYSPVPVMLEDPALASRSFVGVFRLGDTRAFAHAAAAAFDATVREENGKLYLTKN
ncbi:MAG TPA: FecR domain-containing protein [Steroidobacter sp.]